MSNLPQQITINQYISDGVQASNPYTYLILLATDITVYVTLAANPPIPSADIKVLNVDYTVQNVGNQNGGTITWINIPPLGATITFTRNMLASIDTNFINVATISGVNLDGAFLRTMLLIQQLQTFIQNRSLSYIFDSYLPPPTTVTQIPEITNIDNQIWKSQGGTIIASVLDEPPDASTLRSDLANETPLGNGAGIVGYYDTYNNNPTNVADFLNIIPSIINVNTISTQYFQDTGAVNTLQVTLPTSYTSYVAGTYFRVKAANTTTTNASTLKVNALAALPIYLVDGTVAKSGNIVSGGFFEFVTDGTKFYLLNPVPTIISEPFSGASVFITSDQTIAATATTQVIFQSVIYNRNSIFNATNNSFVMPFTGFYTVKCKLFITDPSVLDYTISLILQLNNTTNYTLDIFNHSSLLIPLDVTLSFSIDLNLNQNDFLKIFVDNTSNNDLTIQSSFPCYYQIIYNGS